MEDLTVIRHGVGCALGGLVVQDVSRHQGFNSRPPSASLGANVFSCLFWAVEIATQKSLQGQVGPDRLALKSGLYTVAC